MRLLNPPTFPSAGLLSLRIVVGITFLGHGLDKLSDISGTEQLFASYSIPAPGLMAPFVGRRAASGRGSRHPARRCGVDR